MEPMHELMPGKRRGDDGRPGVCVWTRASSDDCGPSVSPRLQQATGNGKQSDRRCPDYCLLLPEQHVRHLVSFTSPTAPAGKDERLATSGERQQIRRFTDAEEGAGWERIGKGLDCSFGGISVT